jgi:hypothetical protein
MIRTTLDADTGRQARVFPTGATVVTGAGTWCRPPRRRLGTAEPFCAIQAPSADPATRMLREPSAPPRGWFTAGCAAAAAIQMTAALLLAAAVPDAVTNPPAPFALQIAVLPAAPLAAVATPAEATPSKVAPPDRPCCMCGHRVIAANGVRRP